MAGHLLAWERQERDDPWWAWVSWIHEAGGRRDHKMILVRANSLRPPEPPEAVPRRVRGLEGLRHSKDLAYEGGCLRRPHRGKG
jgi:hypothetical protein